MTDIILKSARALRLSTITRFLCALALALGTSFVGFTATAGAWPACGYVNVHGGDYMQGQGVDSHSNYSDEGTLNSCANDGNELNNLGANPPQYGFGWQCEELAERLYNTRGWTSGKFGAAYAALIDSSAVVSANGWSSMAQGSIVLADIHPGDMLVTDEAYYGHVMIVDSVSGNTINAVDQNGGYYSAPTASLASHLYSR